MSVSPGRHDLKTYIITKFPNFTDLEVYALYLLCSLQVSIFPYFSGFLSPYPFGILPGWRVSKLSTSIPTDATDRSHRTRHGFVSLLIQVYMDTFKLILFLFLCIYVYIYWFPCFYVFIFLFMF